MAWNNDKIKKCGEFKSQGEQTANNGAFYLFLAPKQSSDDSMVILNAKVAENEAMVEIPLLIGVWNPVVLNKVNITSELLGKYRIFWGAE